MWSIMHSRPSVRRNIIYSSTGKPFDLPCKHSKDKVTPALRPCKPPKGKVVRRLSVKLEARLSIPCQRSLSSLSIVAVVLQTNHEGARPILIRYIDVNIKALRDVGMLKGPRQCSANDTAAAAAPAASRGGRPGNAALSTLDAPSMPRSLPAAPVPAHSCTAAAQPDPVRLALDGLDRRRQFWLGWVCFESHVLWPSCIGLICAVVVVC